MSSPATRPSTASMKNEAARVFARADQIANGSRVRRRDLIDGIAEVVAATFVEVWEPGLREYRHLEKPSDLIDVAAGKVYELQLFVAGGPMSPPPWFAGLVAKYAKGMIRRRFAASLGVDVTELDRLYVAAHDVAIRVRRSDAGPGGRY